MLPAAVPYLRLGIGSVAFQLSFPGIESHLSFLTILGNALNWLGYLAI